MTDHAAGAVHATAVVVREAGVLIRGPSGAGKTTLALLLIEAARHRGWFARLVGDDRVLLCECHGRVVAAPHPAIAGLVERRTQPIIQVLYEPRCRLVLVVDLAGPDSSLPRLPNGPSRVSLLPGTGPLRHLRLAGTPHALWCDIVFDQLAAV